MEEFNKHFLYPAALIATKTPTVVTTILGTCVAVCLYDPVMKTGGINHYMLPRWDGAGVASAKYGDVAIKQLLEKMLALGCAKSRLQAKVYGGLCRERGGHSFHIGERNKELARATLSHLQIPVISQHVGGKSPRKLTFNTESGIVMMHLLLPELVK